MKLKQSIRYFYKVVKTQTQNKFQTKYNLYDKNKKMLSFWNDIPINLSKDIVNCCVQIPKEHSSKLEVKKQIIGHPFMQDTRKNIYTQEKQLRYYAHFPLFNYGYIPQTWEQNLRPDSTGLIGDGDPIDICQLSYKPRNIGDIFTAKILGSFCLIDQGQIDWKIIMLDQIQSQKRKINQIGDVSRRQIQSIMRWFIDIKVYDGKKPNHIAFNSKIFNKQETINVIKQVHEEWKRLQIEDSQQYKLKRQQYKIKKRQSIN